MKQHPKLEQLKALKLDLDYFDVRIEKSQETLINYKNGELLQAVETPSLGAYIRVNKNGQWLESATTQIDRLDKTLTELSAQVNKLPALTKTTFPKREKKFHVYANYSDKNCTQVDLVSKKTFCDQFLNMNDVSAFIVDWSLSYSDRYKEKWFVASDGVEFYNDYNQAGFRIDYTLRKDDSLFSDSKGLFFMNHEGMEQLAREKFTAEIKESELFLDAKAVAPGHYPVVLAPVVTGVFTHESFGHKSEADFMIGDQTVAKEWSIGKKVAADHISIVDEGESLHTSGYCPIDDEGNVKQKTYLIKDGKLAGRLHNTQTAQEFNEELTGNARAMNFEFGPIVRMTNTYIEPGSKSFNEMISTVKLGVYIKDFKHGMGMSTFTIAPTKAFWIRDGKMAEPVKVSVISGSVFETLHNIEAVSNDFYVHSSAFGGCGKFEQWPLPVADGGPSILVSKMQVS